ncbi:hypothetical protein DM01DRAFT_1332331 [Hesseltinella vesiculosa]|uniref:F-box domain-containing protein n=1 Tax=Hesseltinella vesiculosa TaxID=101127 RepID=A0A1X2GVZ2_9FUNG|nr:hypothetical protein DM01DRAFT_1332331 [Hesseltinella vesiculosa]
MDRCLATLPNEIFSLINQHLSQDDRLTLCYVCRAWHNRFLPILYRHVTLQANRADTLAIALTSCNSPTLQPLGHLVRSLTLSTADPICLEHLEMISKACPFTTALAFDSQTFYASMERLASKRYFDSLLKVPNDSPALVNDDDLDSSLSYIEAIQQLKFPDTVKGPMPMTNHVALAFFKVMFRLFPRLTTLDFPLYYLMFGVPRVPLFVDFLPDRLTDLTLKCRLDLSFPLVESIHDHCPLLESLSLTCRFMKDIYIDTLSVIVMNHRLKSIAIIFDSTDGLSLWSWVWYAGKKYGQQLEAAHFNNANLFYTPAPEQAALVRHTFIPAFVQQHATTLRTLEMKNMAYSQEFWMQMEMQTKGRGTNFRTIDCWDDEILQGQGDEDSLGVTDKIATMAKVSIQRLCLNVCLMDSPFSDFARLLGQCPRLNTLHLAYASLKYSSIPLLHLLQACPQIQHLSLDCRTLALGKVPPEFCHRLVSLDLMYTVHLTSAELNCMLLFTPWLESLKITDSCITTYSEIDQLNSSSPPIFRWSLPNPGSNDSIDSLSLRFSPKRSPTAGSMQKVSITTTFADKTWAVRVSQITPLPQQKWLEQCHLGTQVISGTSFELECNPIRFLEFNKTVLIRKGLALL